MNLFDATHFPTREPEQLVAGDRWRWKRTDLGADYPPASYTLKYALRPEAAQGVEVEITATASGSDFVVEVASSATADYAPGVYRWTSYIVRDSDSERIALERGVVELLPDRDASNVDPRSYAQKVLDAVRATILGTASAELKSVEVEGMSLERRSIKELHALEARYRHRVSAERARLRVQQGLPAGRRVLAVLP